jgi:hypothetical protein
MSNIRSESLSDAPTRLRALSDEQKGRAIANAVERLVGHPVEAEVLAVSYGAFDRLRIFRQPAEIRVQLVVPCAEPIVNDMLKKLCDQDLEESIAISLSKAAGEVYGVGLRLKRYDTGKLTLDKETRMAVTVQVGKV